MVRVVGLVALLAPALGVRVEVHDQFEVDDQVASITARGLELLEQLKENPTDVKLQTEYSELVGDVEFHESHVFLETGEQIQQEPTPLGAQSPPGQVLTMVERTGFLQSLSRFFTSRRDYVWEEQGGSSKYVLDGRTLSLHSRMFVSFAGEPNPRFILRRAFNYLNPLAGLFGQFVYRVIQCSDAQEGECAEGDILYTITKDRLGRGALWGMDEYRVYTGTGGCSRYGIVSCAQEAQIMYSLGSGLSESDFNTDFYKSFAELSILAIHGNGQSGTVQLHGNEVREVGADVLTSMKIGHSSKVQGPPRWLNWIGTSVPLFGAGLEVARAAIWSDSYRLVFHGAADELLVSLLASAQDLTRDTIARRNIGPGALAGAAVAAEAAAAQASTNTAVEAEAAANVAQINLLSAESEAQSAMTQWQTAESQAAQAAADLAQAEEALTASAEAVAAEGWVWTNTEETITAAEFRSRAHEIAQAADGEDIAVYLAESGGEFFDLSHQSDMSTLISAVEAVNAQQAAIEAHYAAEAAASTAMDALSKAQAAQSGAINAAHAARVANSAAEAAVSVANTDATILSSTRTAAEVGAVVAGANAAAAEVVKERAEAAAAERARVS